MSDTFDWFDLLIDVICKRIEEGDPAAAAYLRTRIEERFVPVDVYRHQCEAYEYASKQDMARAEAAEAECLEQARLLGMSGERELALRAELARVKDQAEAAEARVKVLEEALGDLMSWFPDKPSPPEWRLRAGERGADDAVEAARAALGAEHGK